MKKQKSASRKPRYGTRKLSIGLVSCVLGITFLVSPSSLAHADEVTVQSQASAIEEAANPEDETEEKENTTEKNTTEVKPENVAKPAEKKS